MAPPKAVHHAPSPTPTPTPTPSVSKASSSDNWRAPASSAGGAGGAGGGWTVAEKKERKPAAAAVAAAARERKSTLDVSWAAATGSDALASRTDPPVPAVPALPLDTPADAQPAVASTSTPTPTPTAPAPAPAPAPTPIPASAPVSVSVVPPPSLPPKINPWSAVNKAPVHVPVVPVVAGATDWPSPHEPAHPPKRDSRKRDASTASQQDEVALKKKAERTTWLPIKADITVSPTAGPRPATAPSEKRPKAARRDGVAPSVPGAAPSTRVTGERLAGTGAPSTARPTASSSGPAKKETSAPRGAAAPSSTKSVAQPSVSSTTSTSKAAAPNGSAKAAPGARADFALPKKPTVPTQQPAAAASKPSSRPPVLAAGAPVLRPFSGRPPTAEDLTAAASSTLQPASVPFISKPQRAAAEFDAAFTPAPPNGFPRAGNHPNAARGGGRGFGRGRGAMAGQPRGPFTGARVNGFVGQAEQVQQAAMYAPFVPVMMTPEEETKYWLLGQIEYYFSVDNLCRDMFLRSKMDSEGWLQISLIGSFNRIKNLSTDAALVLATMLYTPLLEVSPSHTHVRLAAGWPHWVLPNAIPSVVVGAPQDDGHESTSEDDEGTATAATTVSSRSGSQADESASADPAVESTNESTVESSKKDAGELSKESTSEASKAEQAAVAVQPEAAAVVVA